MAKRTKPVNPPSPAKLRGVNAYKVPYKFVEIIWDDASSNSESWANIKDIAEPEQVISRGWLVKETGEPGSIEGYVCVAASLSNEELAEEVVGNTMTVPRGMIVSMRELSVRTTKPKKPKVAEPK
jgi:hypothetical protein